MTSESTGNNIKLQEQIIIIVVVVIKSHKLSLCNAAIYIVNAQGFPKINIRIWNFHFFHLPENGTACVPVLL